MRAHRLDHGTQICIDVLAHPGHAHGRDHIEKAGRFTGDRRDARTGSRRDHRDQIDILCPAIWFKLAFFLKRDIRKDDAIDAAVRAARTEVRCAIGKHPHWHKS